MRKGTIVRFKRKSFVLLVFLFIVLFGLLTIMKVEEINY